MAKHLLTVNLETTKTKRPNVYSKNASKGKRGYKKAYRG